MEEDQAPGSPRERGASRNLTPRSGTTHGGAGSSGRPGRPAPTVHPPPPSARERFRHELEESFPLLFFAAACFIMSAFALSTNTHVGGTRYPLWVLFLTLGVIAAGGGTASLFASDDLDGFDEEGLASGELVVVPRKEWEGLRRRAVPSVSMARSREGIDLVAEGPAVPPDPARGPRPEWEEREDDREVVTPLDVTGPPEVGLVPRSEDIFAELDSLDAALGPPRTRPARSGIDHHPAIDRRAERTIEVDGPEDPSGSDPWLDAAQLPPELAGMIEALSPSPTVASGLAPLAPRRPAAPVPPPRVECVNCGGAIRSSREECSTCHSPMCRTCHDMARLTSEEARCDRCLSAPRPSAGQRKAGSPPQGVSSVTGFEETGVDKGA